MIDGRLNYNAFYDSTFKNRIIRGNQKEIEFAELLNQSSGYTFTAATVQENIYQHFDLKLSHPKDRNTKIRYVDVKEQSKINGQFSDEYVWIELQNNLGFYGWLFTCEMLNHLIAFEFTNEWLIVKADDLRELVRCKKLLNGITKNPQFANIQLYSRKHYLDRCNDLLILISKKELKTIITAELKKASY